MSTSDERGRVAKDKPLSHAKQVVMAKALKEQGHSNSKIAYVMRINESTVRVLLRPRITEEQTIWFPGIYGGRTDEEYTTTVGELEDEKVIELVQKRAQEDGEWAIENGFVGDNEDKMRRMMAFVADEKNITQCLGHVYKENMGHERTVDWVCRDLANASKWAANVDE